MTIDTIDVLFAVIEDGSIYEITSKKDEDGCPIVTMTMAIGTRPHVMPRRIRGGSRVGLSGGGILLYNEDNPVPGAFQLPEEIDRSFYGESSFGIVALFLNKTDAIRCTLAVCSLQRCDTRWWTQTKAVVDAIGKNHPVFTLSESDPVLKFPLPPYVFFKPITRLLV